MVTQNYNTTSARDIEQALKQIRSSQNNIGKTSSWYETRLQQLETEQNRLYQYIKDCQTYLDYQRSHNKKLKAKLHRLQEIYEEDSEKKLWFCIPRTWIKKALMLSIGLLSIGILLALLGL